jgi:hypothetical protein
MAKKFLKNVRINPITGEPDYFFPMEIMDPADKEYAKLNGLEVGKAMLGFRTFEAIMIPCKNKGRDAKGREIYLDTPSEEQHRIYISLCKDELDSQEDMKQDGRCNIPDGHGGLKRCPLRVSNPAYTPGSNLPKTLTNKCIGCPYEWFKHAHTTIELSCLDHEDENGEMEPYEPSSPCTYYAGDCYEELGKEFVDFIKERKPRLAPLAELLVLEYNQSDASEVLGKSIKTVHSQRKNLEKLIKEFLDNALLF